MFTIQSRAGSTPPRDPHVPPRVMGASLARPVPRAVEGVPRVVAGAVGAVAGAARRVRTFSFRALSSVASPSSLSDDYVWTEADPSLQCACRLTDNFFVRRLRMHVSFDGTREAFESAYADALEGLSEEDIAEILAELRAERRRRETHFAEARERRAFVKARYRALHPDVFTLNPEAHLDARFRELASACRRALAESSPKRNNDSTKTTVTRECADVIRQRPAGVFAFPVFSELFCRKLREECAHFERSGMPLTRPNTMNDNGLLLFELGMYEKLLDPFVRDYVAPVASALFGDGDDFSSETTSPTLLEKPKHARRSPGATTIDHHRSFLVRYDAATDRELDLAYHYDDAEITLNVNLGGLFEGGELLFGGSGEDARFESHVSSNRTPVTHREGVGIMHRGAHCHEATPTESGKRVNLIAWCRSSDARRRRCAMCFRVRET